MGCNKTLCDELERIHVRAAKIIYRLDLCILAEDVLNTLKWQPANRNSLFGDTVKKIFHFPLLEIFSPFPQTENLFTGYLMEAFGAYFSHMLLRVHALPTKTLIS